MRKTFDGPIVFGQVQRVPSREYFFVKNGSPRNIFCHINQGGGALNVTRGGYIVMKNEGIMMPPAIDDPIVLIRESQDPANEDFTEAKMWVRGSTWEKVAWALNFHKLYKAIGYEHRINGQLLEDGNREIILVKNKLIGIVLVNPYRTDEHDQLGETYTYHIGTKSHSYRTRWERLGPDGLWVKCDDPRPKHPVTF